MSQGTKRKRTNEGGSNDTIEDNTHQELIDMTSPTSTITSKTNQIGVGTLINNLQPPNVVVTDNRSASCWSGLTTAKGEYLYKAQKGSFEETMYQFMKRCGCHSAVTRRTDGNCKTCFEKKFGGVPGGNDKDRFSPQVGEDMSAGK